MRRLAPLVLLVIAAAAACTTEKPAAPPTPTQTTAAIKTATPTPEPVDPMKVPEAWRTDVVGLPPHFGKSLAFIKTMLDGHETTMRAVVCYCCGKSLYQCYADTAKRAAKACSPL